MLPEGSKWTLGSLSKMAEIYIVDIEWNVCSNCEHWDKDIEDPIWGRCREGPAQPVIIREGVVEWRQPKMEARAGCGRFVQSLVGKIPIQVEGEGDAEGL